MKTIIQFSGTYGSLVKADLTLDRLIHVDTNTAITSTAWDIIELGGNNTTYLLDVPECYGTAFVSISVNGTSPLDYYEGLIERDNAQMLAPLFCDGWDGAVNPGLTFGTLKGGTFPTDVKFCLLYKEPTAGVEEVIGYWDGTTFEHGNSWTGVIPYGSLFVVCGTGAITGSIPAMRFEMTVNSTGQTFGLRTGEMSLVGSQSNKQKFTFLNDGTMLAIPTSLEVQQGIDAGDWSPVAEAVRDVDNTTPATDSLGEAVNTAAGGGGPGASASSLSVSFTTEE